MVRFVKPALDGDHDTPLSELLKIPCSVPANTRSP
jgi:hypothetical protein